MADAETQNRTKTPLETHQRLRERVTEAIIAQAEIRHAPLNAFLRKRLSGTDVGSGALLTQPVFEGAAPYKSSGLSLDKLKDIRLNPRLIASLVGKEGDAYRFDYPSYTHQVEAWGHLRADDPRSVLVSSGTGSGKTECFLVPLLDDLACEVEAAKAGGSGRLSGVRALMLYPLNALIASQEQRLQRWAAPFSGDIRFALFNGLMLDKRKSDRDAEEAKTPEQVRYRTTLRSDPPPILVTNTTMLEYMTIRREDQPILQASQGLLRWIVIDEAHSYVGSAAAEISLLLRRVLQAFGVKAQQVRFVATSATIGRNDAQGRADLQRYLADLAGVPTSQVHVVMGERDRVDLNAGNALTEQSAMQSLVKAIEESPLDFSMIEKQIAGSGIAIAEALAAITYKPVDGHPLLPLRVHNFVRAVGGLWSCLNNSCPGEKPADWPFGMVHFARTDQCVQCASPVFEIVSCRECGEPLLQAYDHVDRLHPRAVPGDRDDFVTAQEREGDGEEPNDDEATEAPAEQLDGTPVLIATRAIEGMTAQTVETSTGALPDKRGDHQLWISRHANTCPSCLSAATATRRSPLLPFRFGAPFILQNATPTMLEGVTPSEREGLALPSEGRQLLSFTDSRQGTARFAANIETQSERGFVRGFIYHAVQQAAFAVGSVDRDLLIDKVNKLKAADAVLFADQISKLEAQLSGTAATPTLSWNEAVAALAAEPEIKTMTKVWDNDRDTRYANNAGALANMLMLRELARRPRRANSVETLGLVKLVAPHIEKLSDSTVPNELARSGYGLSEWREFLYFLLDGVIRQNFIIDIDREDARWLLPRNAYLRQVVGPGRDKLNTSDQRWPRANPSGVKTNAQRVLERALGLDADSGMDRAAIDDILSAAFDRLRPLLEGSGSTLALRFERLALASIGESWLCPVTNRVLPRLLFGRTFHGLRNHAPGFEVPPVPIKFPSLPSSFPRNLEARAALEQFVATDVEIASLRTAGVWGNLHDRAATFAPYIRAEEHSAQQPPYRLRAFEAEFQRGEINLLACSTTMEMGVDIGSVEAVLNTNVPPSIANYRQRVGRAGRRAQSYASSLTFARDLPLDREAFRAPVTYLARQMRAPSVKLDSDRIVQRHVNALLLATWLREADGQLTRIRAGDFFGFAQEDGLHMPDPSPVSRFVNWLKDPSTAARMSNAILDVTTGSRIRNASLAIEAAKDKFEFALDGFGRAWDGLQHQKAALAADARRSVELQIKRMCREPLLSELGTRSVLPSHGFPTGVMPFVTACAANRDKMTGDDPSETSRNRRYDYPSRAGPVAIREYAPGAEVVIDGLVWTSAGVTLNWQRPAHEEGAREIQSIRYSWSCRDCGESDCGRADVEACLACGSIQLDRQRFLEPAGFRVDWRAQPHADTNVPFYITPEPPQISARGARWEPLLDPALGRGRTTGDGLVFHHARGAARNGYRICLDCGRAAEDGPGALADHDALMPPKGGAGYCIGNTKQYAITAALALGHETLTDVAEFQPSAVSDPRIALALASALREALSRALGIETRELGVAISRRQTQLGDMTHSIFLFDQSSGGAGYAPRVFDDVAAILKSARAQLDCPVSCQSACSACVLSVDVYADADAFDRNGAINVIDKMLAVIATPEAADVAGTDAVISAPVGDVIARRVGDSDTISIYLPKSFDLAALGDQPLSSALAVIKAKGGRTNVVLPENAFATLDDAARAGIRDASHRHGFTICTGESPLGSNGAPLIAVMACSDVVTGFYCRDEEAALPGPRWGTGGDAAIIEVKLDAAPAVTQVSFDDLERKSAVGSRVRFLERDPGRPLTQFGQLFVGNVIRPELEAAGLWKPGELVALTYSDRYLKAPLPTVLALRTLSAIRDALVGKGKRLPLSLTTERLKVDRNAGQPRYLGQNWLDEDVRADTIEELAAQLGFDCTYVDDVAPHGRKLSLKYSDGSEAILLFDQGFGYWRTQTNDHHNFRASPSKQAKELLEARAFVAGHGDSYIAVTTRRD
jgi:DEAD/DEAH box helicase domain-containing protein